MSTLEKNDVNEVILQGPIVFKNKNDFATNLRIKVARGHLPVTAKTLKDDSSLYNWAEIAIYDPLLKVKADAFKTGNEVKIKAMINVNQKTSKITNKLYFDQKLVALDIEPATPIFDDLSFDCPSYCKFKLTGTISNIKIYKNTLEISLRTITNKSVNNIQTFLYSNNPEELARKYMVGERVSLYGDLQTPKKITNGVAIYHKNYIVNRIVKES